MGKYLLALARGVIGTRGELGALRDDVNELASRMDTNTKRMEARFETMETVVQGLQGTFTSIEVHLLALFEREVDMKAWRERIEARVDALEKGRPPAA